MRFLSDEEAVTWCDQLSGRLVCTSGRPHLSMPFEKRIFRVPSSVREAFSFLQMLTSLLNSDFADGALLWIWDFEIGSEEFVQFGIDSIEILRRGLGESRPLATAPATLFASEERQQLLLLAAALLGLLWETYIVPRSGNKLLFFNEDLLYVYSHDPLHGWSSMEEWRAD